MERPAQKPAMMMPIPGRLSMSEANAEHQAQARGSMRPNPSNDLDIPAFIRKHVE
jgi:hypothetical protein